MIRKVFAGLKPNDIVGQEYLIGYRFLEKQNGFVPNAAYKTGIGDIGFVWGKHKPAKNPQSKSQGTGIKHIEVRRFEDGRNGTEFVKEIPKIIEKGKNVIDNQYLLNKNIATNNDMIAINQSYWNRKQGGLDNRNILKTAYHLYDKNKAQVESIINKGIPLSKDPRFVPYNPLLKEKLDNLKMDAYHQLLKFWGLR